MEVNNTALSNLPPLPTYTTIPLPPLVPGIPDPYLTLLLPIIAYWSVSMLFHTIDTYDLFPQYRLHTPAEVLKRNHVSRWDVLRDVVVQQVVQTAFGVFLAAFEEDAVGGTEEFKIALWARRIRRAQGWVPAVLGVVGVDANGLAEKLGSSHSTLAGAISGGIYPHLTQTLLINNQPTTVPAFASWELLAAKTIYHLAIPALQFTLAILIVDTWQYFLHRYMHQNKYLYTRFHSRHHRLYVPYAYGALYNHPLEGFLLDTLGTGLAYLVSGMTVRQSMWFFTCTTIKTVDDHCGYAFPWDPLQHVTGNNAGYHDVHHQSWGIKKNFSQPFFTFWDRILGTKWMGGDTRPRYERERQRVEAEKKGTKDVEPEILDVKPKADSETTTSSTPAPSTTSYESYPSEEISVQQRPPPSKQRNSTQRRRTGSGLSLKGFADRVGESLHGKSSGVLGVESGRR